MSQAHPWGTRSHPIVFRPYLGMAEGPGGLLNPTTLVGTKTEPLKQKPKNKRDGVGSHLAVLSGQQKEAGPSLTKAKESLGVTENPDLSDSQDVPGAAAAGGALTHGAEGDSRRTRIGGLQSRTLALCWEERAWGWVLLHVPAIQLFLHRKLGQLGVPERGSLRRLRLP